MRGLNHRENTLPQTMGQRWPGRDNLSQLGTEFDGGCRFLRAWHHSWHLSIS